jgi:hypothetical protein
LIPLVNNSFSFTSLGSNVVQTWKKLDLPPTYTSSRGGTATVTQNGTTNLVFTNSQGQQSPGYWTSPTTLTATSWGITGTVGNGRIVWSNGDVWSESLTLIGTKNGVSGKTTSITASAPTAVLPAGPTVQAFQNNANPAQSEYVVRLGTTTALFMDEAGNEALGTLSNNGTTATITAWGVTATFNATNITFSGAVPGGSTQWNATPLTTSPFNVFSYVNATSALPQYVVQNKSNTTAVFINDVGTWVIGTVSGTTATATGLGLGTGTLSTGIITWSNGGVVWVQTTLSANVTTSYFYDKATGKAEQMLTNGNYRIFVNDAGSIAFGVLNAAKTQATIAAWSQIATFSGVNITFAKTSAPNTVIATWLPSNSLLPLVTFTDTDGTVFHVRITASNQLTVVDGNANVPANVVGTRNSKQINWSNNSSAWNNYDFNALNALFQMGAGYP